MTSHHLKDLLVTPVVCPVSGKLLPPEEWLAAAVKATRDWRVPGLMYDEECGYPLIDALSNDEPGATVKEGIERAEELAHDITFAIWKALLHHSSSNRETA